MSERYDTLKVRYDALKDRFAQLGRRERLVIVVGSAAAILLVGFTVADGSLAKLRKLEKQLLQVTTDTANARVQVAELTRQLAQDPNTPIRARMGEIRQEISRIDAEVEGVHRGLVAPKRMAGLLKDMLTRNQRVQLISLKTLPVGPLVVRAQNAESHGGYKHGIEFTLQGSYLDLLDYLAQLERLPWQMFWGQSRIDASGYPDVRMTVTVFTLSLDKNWLEV